MFNSKDSVRLSKKPSSHLKPRNMTPPAEEKEKEVPAGSGQNMYHQNSQANKEVLESVQHDLDTFN